MKATITRYRLALLDKHYTDEGWQCRYSARTQPVDLGAIASSAAAKFEARNPSHKVLMSVLGCMSESEREHVQSRVRAAVAPQVINDGRRSGGRARYGYIVADGEAHPNPRMAAEAHRLRVLTIDVPSATVSSGSSLSTSTARGTWPPVSWGDDLADIARESSSGQEESC